MSTLNASIGRLPRFAPGLVNLNEVAAFLNMDRPLSVAALQRKIDGLPEFVDFRANIETGTALRGEIVVTLNKDGSNRFRGFMRATGALSFAYRLSAIVRSKAGTVTVAAVHSGKVFGTDTPGNRQDNWDEVDTKPERMKLIRNIWPDISAGKLSVNRSTELTGVLGATSDIIKDVAQLFIVAQTGGAALAICLVIGNELGDAGVDVPGLGGVVGLGIVAGSLIIWGPLSIGPAILIGVGAGAITDALVKIRRMTPAEEDFARVVFGDSIDFDEVRLTNLSGVDTAPFVTPTVDGTILVNLGNAIDDPVGGQQPNYPVKGQLLIHELVHVWQIQHARLEDGYIPGWLCRGIGQKTEGKAAYRPGEPGPAFSSFGIEAQAAIVDHWFAGNKGAKPAPKGSPEAIPMNENHKYFRYINENIRLGAA